MSDVHTTPLTPSRRRRFLVLSLKVLGALFFLTLVGMVLTWAFVCDAHFTRTVGPGDTYTVGKRTYHLPTVPLLNTEGESLSQIKILSEDFLCKQRLLLEKTHALLTTLSIPYFISGGTLIGFTMPGLESMMPHDYDLDVHVTYDHRDYLWSSAFAQACAHQGLEAIYLRVSTLKLATREGAAVRLRLPDTRMPVLDIFFEHQDPQDGLWKKVDGWTPQGTLNYNSKEQWTEEEVYPLVTKEVDGLTLSFPQNPTALLTKQYGKRVHERIVVPHRMLSHAFPYEVFGSAVWRKGA